MLALLTLLCIAAPSEVDSLVARARTTYPDFVVEPVDGLGFVLATPRRAPYRARVHELITQVHASTRVFFGDRTPDLLDAPWLVVVLPNKSDYRRFAKRHLAGRPIPQLGFADPAQRLIAIDHGPGEGTLAHELVHPLMARAFPRAPAWLTEALPALYEHKAFAPLRFFPNWRTRHIRRDVALEPLFAADLAAVRADDHHHLVGLGRHLLVYLHQRGRLFDYLAALEQRLRHDPRDAHLASLEALAATWPDFSLAAFTADLKTWLRR